jgi:hypothetical protein
MIQAPGMVAAFVFLFSVCKSFVLINNRQYYKTFFCFNYDGPEYARVFFIVKFIQAMPYIAPRSPLWVGSFALLANVRLASKRTC